MKSGWIARPLREVAKTQYGLSEAMSESGDGFKIFRMGELQGGRLVDTGRMKRAAISAAEFERYALRKGDVLFNRTNSFELVGKTGIFDLDGEYCFASYLVRLTVDRDRLLPEFLNYFMNSAAFQASVKSKASRSINQANINASILGAETVHLPESLQEQRRIVALLDEAFEGIATAKAHAEKNLLNVYNLFANDAAAVFAEGARRWQTLTLDQISENLDSRRVPITKSDRVAGDIPYYGASGIVDYVDGYIFEGDALLVSEDGANLLARSTPIAFPATGRYWVNNHAHILKFDQMATQRFVELYLESIPLDRYITGAAQPKLNQKALNSIPIPLPPTLEEQEQVVVRLSRLAEKCDELRDTYERKLVALAELKQSLLHQAFTGAL